MHKTFYASGFLYHSPTQQILLQQQLSSSSPVSPWSLFSSAYAEKEDEKAFKNVIAKLLHIKITTIYAVYSYFNEKTNIHQTVVYSELEEPEKAFKNVIAKLLHIKITTVYAVYSYFNEKTNIHQTVIYSKLEELRNFTPKNGLTFAWFSFKDVLKLQATAQTKHDIVVGQRVIQASERKDRGEHTFQ